MLNYLLKSVHDKVKTLLHEIWIAETHAAANIAFDRFIATCRAKVPQSKCLAKDRWVLLAFYDLPAEPWVHLRAINLSSQRCARRATAPLGQRAVCRGRASSGLSSSSPDLSNSFKGLRGFERLTEVIAGLRFVLCAEDIAHEQ